MSAYHRGAHRPATRVGGADSVSILTLYVVLLFAVPAPMVVTALGQVGGPATLVAVACFAIWLWHVAHASDLERTGPWSSSLVRSSVAFLLVSVAAYAHSATLPLPADERSPSDSSIIRIVGFIGVACLAAQGVRTSQRLCALVERISWAMGAISLFAVAQVVTGQALVDRIDIPGLSPGDNVGLQARGVVTRPSGTATHPIEFAAVLAIGLPFVVAAASRRGPRQRMFAAIVVLVSVMVLMTGSRTSVVCGLVAFLAMMPAWSTRMRLFALLLCGIIVATIFVTLPGFVGTIRGLFLGSSDDSSVQSRTNSYNIVQSFWEKHPLIGRGLGTFLPRYWILDNQYLQIAIGAGILGILALLWVLTSAIRAATAATKMTGAEEVTLAICVRASVLAGSVALALFDVFGFAQAAGMLFLSLGMCGAVCNLSRTKSLPGQLKDSDWHSPVVRNVRP